MESDNPKLFARLRDKLRRWIENISNRSLLLIAVVLALAGLVVAYFTSDQWWDGIGQNFSTEMIGAAITFVMIEILLAGRREREAEKREKDRLILQMGSPFNESAVEAARQLRARGWLTDGSLEEARCFGANLQGVSLTHANLQGADFMQANLQGAMLLSADLRDTQLGSANLRETLFLNSDLRGAWLLGADMRSALGLTCDQLRQVGSLSRAILPDGTQLPDDTWREAFEAWCETVELDERGYIIPVPPDDDTE